MSCSHVDALHEKVAGFYESLGFRRTPGSLVLVQKVADIEAALTGRRSRGSGRADACGARLRCWFAQNGKVGTIQPMAITVETDDRSRVVLPGHRNQRFLVQEMSDGSLLLQPALVVSEAQHEYDSDEKLRELLARAAAAPSVRRRRVRRSV